MTNFIIIISLSHSIFDIHVFVSCDISFVGLRGERFVGMMMMMLLFLYRSLGRVQMNVWNKAVVSRKNQLGMLSLNDQLPVKGRSGGYLRELNLRRRLYLGGYPGGIYHPDSAVTVGLLGAIQRVSAVNHVLEFTIT